MNKTLAMEEYSYDDSESISLGEVTFMIKNMNYLINFFLYSLLSKLFRQELLAMIGGDHMRALSECLRVSPRRRRGEDPSSSSFAELSFSVEAFKSLKKGQYRETRGKFFFFRVEPANFFTYFRHVGRHNNTANKKKRSPHRHVVLCQQKLLEIENEIANLDQLTGNNVEQENAFEEIQYINNNGSTVSSLENNKPVLLLKKSKTYDGIPTQVAIKFDPSRPIAEC